MTASLHRAYTHFVCTGGQSSVREKFPVEAVCKVYFLPVLTLHTVSSMLPEDFLFFCRIKYFSCKFAGTM